LKRLGVVKVYVSSRPNVHLGSADKPAILGDLLKALGWTLAEETYCMLLENLDERRIGPASLRAS
jgi:hypothetical protein